MRSAFRISSRTQELLHLPRARAQVHRLADSKTRRARRTSISCLGGGDEQGAGGRRRRGGMCSHGRPFIGFIEVTYMQTIKYNYRFALNGAGQRTPHDTTGSTHHTSTSRGGAARRAGRDDPPHPSPDRHHARTPTERARDAHTQSIRQSQETRRELRSYCPLTPSSAAGLLATLETE